MSDRSIICRKLNDAGIPSPGHYRWLKGITKDKRCSKSNWSTTTIIKILQNPVYLGNMVQGRHVGSICDGKGRRRTKPQDWIIVKDTHEPIVTQELFDEVQSIMEKLSAQFKTGQGKYAHFKKPELLLKGLLFCADCGKPLYRYKSVRCNGKYCDWIYLCRTSDILKTCPIKSIHEPELYQAIYDAIRIQISMCAHITGIIAKLNQESNHKSRLAIFDSEIEESEREIKRITSLRRAVFEDYSAKVLTTSEYQYAINKYDSALELQTRRLETAKCNQLEYTQCSTPANKWIVSISQFMDAKELTAEMAQSLIERVEISNRNCVSITFKYRNELMAICKYSEYPLRIA